jgi:tetratricopeptide (TPR) repeat protein
MPDHERAARRAQSDALSTAIEAAKQHPDKPQHWELVEELVDTAQRPSDVRELFRSVLHKPDLGPSVATQVGQRAVRFYEAWYGDDPSELAELLMRVLERDQSADWAFERLTVALTVAERWNDLLTAYDTAIARADQTTRRMKLLDEAAQLAKDFAAQPDRAIGYMHQLYALDPDNAGLASSLERLLERQGRWVDLIGLWRTRAEVQPARQQRDTQLRMASCYLDALRDPASALRETERVLKDAPDYKPALDLLERVLVADGSRSPERRTALRYLRDHFSKNNKPQEVVRVLEQALSFAAVEDRRALLRELVERAIDLREDSRAMQHQATLLVLDPLPKERDALRSLAERTRNFEQYAQALADAARTCGEPNLRVELLMEAAHLREENLGQLDVALGFYNQVFSAGVSADSTINAGRRLLRLLEQTDRERDTLDVLSRMCELEPVEAVRKSMLGKLAQLAEKLGEHERARRAWSSRVGDDVNDVEALDALIVAAARDEDHKGLVKLLRQRTQARGASHQRRADLIWLAKVHDEKLHDLDAAIGAWREVRQLFGEDHEAVSALTELLSRAERWAELADVLSQAAEGEVRRFTELQTQLGDAYRARLAKPDLAVLRYRLALQVDPSHAHAREGQKALLDHELCRAIAVSSLAEAFKQTDEWQSTFTLLEARLDSAKSSQARAEILIESAELAEQRAADPARALELYRRAFTCAPDDRATERAIRRLAEQLGRWDAVVAAYRETIANFRDVTPRVGELRYAEGLTLETRLGDADAALDAYCEAAHIAPEREDFTSAAARVAAQLGRWELAAREVIACCAAKRAVLAAPFEMLEQAARDVGAWDALGTALDAALANAPGQLEANVKRDLHRRSAQLHRMQRNDAVAAEVALCSALACDPLDRNTLLALAEVQRGAPGPALVQTLRRLADVERDSLDALWEAAEVCGATPESAEVLAALYERAVFLWRRGQAPSGTRKPSAAASFSVERLSALYRSQHEALRALELLTEAARLPFEPAAIQALLLEAAALAATALNDTQRATQLYRDVLTRDARDPHALSALAKLYVQDDRLPELLALRRHELALDPKGPRKLELRLEIARLLGELEARGDRLSALSNNLAEQPGHKPSLDALNQLLRQKGHYAELAQLFEAQARVLTTQGHRPEAAWLWREVAVLRERELSDMRSALLGYRELHELEPTGDASEALARLYSALGDHALAAEWLEIRLGSAPPEARAATAVALARAHIAAGQNARARDCLEQALAEHPSVQDARDLLARLYREDGSHELLARVLSQGAESISDPARRLAYLREAADLYCDKLRTPDRAIPVLQRATELAPDDVRLRSMLAEGLHVAGRFDEARSVLKALVEGFGRKRSSERAELHYQLARVAESASQLEEAFSELEHASKMDLGHQGALHMLARLAQQQGDLDRAERAYRGLLLLLRRQRSEAEDALGPSEVFFELYRIALSRKQQQAADELLASALENAGQNDLEARRFTRVLRARGAADLLMRVLDTRLALAREPKLEAELLSAKADLLEHEQGKPGPALELRLRALSLDEHSDALHSAALALSIKSDELSRYLDLLTKLAEEAQRTRSPAGTRSYAGHMLRLGRVIEDQLKDLDRAAGLYAKVEASGECVTEAWLSMARVAGARGDRAEQRRVLVRIANLTDARAGKAERNEARFLLAELELNDADWRDQGVASLEEALQASQDYARAKRVLAHALEQMPEHGALLLLCERVARASNDETLLLSCIERRAARPGGTLEEVREGIELALRRSELQRAERLLERARALYLQDRTLSDNPTWVFSGLCECRLQAKDTPAAMQYLREAVAYAPEQDAQALARELAQLASGPDGDLELAAETYAQLLEREPADRTLWEPMLSVLTRRKDKQHLDVFVARTLSALLMVEDRVFLQLAYANFLIDSHRDKDAAQVLRALLDEDATHSEATDKLLGIYQRHGMDDALADLLRQLFDRARDERNVVAICELGLKLGDLFAAGQPEQACDAYRQALEWDPDHRGLLAALLAHLPADTEARERCELKLRLLKTETGAAATRLALELADAFGELSDDERVQEALELGYRGSPADDELRDRLEGFYAERQLYRPLAELMQVEAERLGPSVEAVARYKNAATIYREQLHDVDGAAAALRAALAIVPDDLSLLGELARNLAAAGQHATAIEDVTRLLDGHMERDSGRVDLLRVRAGLCSTADRLDEAVVDLEEAYAVAGTLVAPELLDALQNQQERARAQGDAGAARSASLRLVGLFDALGDAERARDILAGWTELSPDDVESWSALRIRDAQAGRSADVARSCQRLVALTQGEARIDAALGLAQAHAELGHPEAALPWLLRVHEDAPDAMDVRDRLRQLFTQLGQHRELAALLMGDAAYASEASEKLERWLRAAELFLAVGEPQTAIDPLRKAMEVAPEDDRTRLLLVDIELSLGRIDEAAAIVDQAMTAHKRRRSPELAMFQQRMGRICALRGDHAAQLKWLNTALDTDRKSGEVASELVEVSMAIGDHDTAMKALRTLTMMEDPRPITRALAFLRQAQIAVQKGDVQRAQHWARKAKSLDENLTEADDFLAQIAG